MDIQLSVLVSPPRVQPSPSPQPPSPQPPSPQSPSPHPPLPPVQQSIASSTSMPPPPEAIYSSKEELYASIQAWAALHYYAFRIGRSTKIHGGSRIKITYNCDRYGPPPPDKHPQNRIQARIRQTTTRKTGCQFSITAIQRTDTQWELRHRPGTEYSIHNHPPSQSISSHPSHRKLAQAEINQAKSLHNAGICLSYSFKWLV
jgi:hypothetical protein